MKIYTGIAKRTCVIKDVREEFANVICEKVAGVAALVLAQKIYTSEGDTDFSEKEVEIMMAVAKMCTPNFIISFFIAIGEELKFDNI